MNKEKKYSSKEKDNDDVFWISPDRIVALTDGVFAITMTLLVLELHASEIMKHFGESGWLEIYVYFTGFMALGIYWSLHHYIFHFIKRANGALVWWNILFLAVSTLVPFWTKVINPTAGEELILLAPFYYGMFMIITFLILRIIWVYVTNNRYLVGLDFDKRKIKAFDKTLFYGSLMVGIISIVATIIPILGWLLFIPGGFFIYVTVHGPHKVFK